MNERTQPRPDHVLTSEAEVLAVVAEKSGITVTELKALRRTGGLEPKETNNE